MKSWFFDPLAPYDLVDYERRQRARMTYALAIVFFLVIGILGIYNYFLLGNRDPRLLFSLALMFPLNILVILLLLKGRDELAQNAFVITPTLAVWGVMFTELHGSSKPIAITDTVVFLYAVLILAALFSTARWTFLPAFFLGNAVLLVAFTLEMERLHSPEEGFVVEFLGDNFLTMTIIFICTTAVRSLNENALRVARSERDKNEEFLNTLEDRVVARTAELEQQKQIIDAQRTRYQELVENANSVILRWDDSGEVTYFNEFAERIFGFTREEIIGRHVVGTIVPETESGGRDLRPLMDDICKHPKQYEYNENENMRKDGSRLWVAWTNKVFRVEETGKLEALSIGTDITANRQASDELRRAKEEAEKANDELRKAQSVLVQNAHRAGMSQVATSVLHDIGNILTSVITSAEQVRDHTRSDTLLKFKKANALLREQGEDKVRFIAEDPRGETLLEYYLQLDETLSRETKEIITASDRLTDKVNIIREAIDAQQAYSTVRTADEMLAPHKVINDSLVIQSEWLRSHAVRIDKDFDEVPKVFANRTKLLHIYINLIKNSCEALILNAADDRRLRIAIFVQDDFVITRFEDNGVGIEKDLLTKVFNHGFTTKRNGHGFGLHSCANFMAEMGGWMRAESEGRNCGSAMVLALPVVRRTS